MKFSEVLVVEFGFEFAVIIMIFLCVVISGVISLSPDLPQKTHYINTKDKQNNNVIVWDK